MSKSQLRVGLLGARRAAQERSPWIPELVERAGGRVVAIAARKFSALDRVAPVLEKRLGHGVEGHVGVDSLLANAGIDVLVIAAPAAMREDALLAALDRGIHVLCEEPVVAPGSRAADRYEMIADSFEAAGLHLQVNVPWARTLPSYYELFPNAQGVAIDSFQLRMKQSKPGLTLLPESMAHPLSLLQELRPDCDAAMRSPNIDFKTEDGSVLAVEFDYDDGERMIACTVDLSWDPEPARSISYGINGMIAEGVIDRADSGLSFRDGGRSVALEDPLAQLVADFLQRIETGTPAQREARATERMRLLQVLLA